MHHNEVKFENEDTRPDELRKKEKLDTNTREHQGNF